MVFTFDSRTNAVGFNASWKITRSKCLQCPAAVLEYKAALYSSKNGIPCSWTCERDYFSDGTSCLASHNLTLKGCPVGEYVDRKSGRGCTNCTNGPRGSMYITDDIATTQNNCDWDCNGGGECPDAYTREWFMGPALSSNVLIGAMLHGFSSCFREFCNLLLS